MTSLLSWSVDTNGQLTYVSQSALNFFRKIPSAVLGQHSDVLLGQRLDIGVQTEISLKTLAHNGRQIFIQSLRVYEDKKMVGVRFIASFDTPLKPSVHFFDKIFNISSWALALSCAVLSLGCVVSIALGYLVAPLIAAAALVSLAGRWNHLRSRVAHEICAVKNHSCLHDLTAIPKSVRSNALVSSCHRTQLFSLSAYLRNQDALQASNVFSESARHNRSPIVITDGQLNIVQSNPAFSELFDNTAQYFEGRPLCEFVPLTTIPFNSVVFEASRNGRTFSVCVNPVFADNEVVHVSFEFTDVTVLRQDEQSLLSLMANPETQISLQEHSVFLDNVKHIVHTNHTENIEFIRKAFMALNCDSEHNTHAELKKDLLVQLRKIGQQIVDLQHLSQNLNTHKSLLGDFIPHQSNLLDALLEEISRSNQTSSLLEGKSSEIQKFSVGLHNLLKALSVKSHEQKIKIDAIQKDITSNTEHLNALRLECENPVLNVELSLEERLHQQQTASSLSDVSGMAQNIQSNFVQWDQETNEFLKLINQAAVSSYNMLQAVSDNSAQIKNLIKNVENTYEVVDVMCQDQIVHSSIGEYINHEVNSIQATLKSQ